MHLSGITSVSESLSSKEVRKRNFCEMNYQCYIIFHLKENIYTLRYFLETLQYCFVSMCTTSISQRSQEFRNFMTHFALGTSILVWTISSIVPCSCGSPVMPQRCWSRWQNSMDGFWLTDPKTKANNGDIQNTDKCCEDHSALLLRFFCVLLWNTD